MCKIFSEKRVGRSSGDSIPSAPQPRNYDSTGPSNSAAFWEWVLSSRGVSGSQPKMVVDSATKYYATRSGAVHALDKVTLEVREGEFLCILGPSGCGKTTLLWSMAGLHTLTEGEIRLGRERIVQPHPEIAMIFQDANLLPWRNLLKNIALPFEIKGRRPDFERISRLLERVNLKGFENKMPRELSGGMQQRASIVRSLAVNPSVLLMDEPFGALDAFTRDEMNLLIQEIWMETRKTIAFVTHLISEAIFLADRVVVKDRLRYRMRDEGDRLARLHPDFLDQQIHFVAREGVERRKSRPSATRRG